MTSRTHTYVGDADTRRQQDQGLEGVKIERNRAYVLIVALVAALVATGLGFAGLAPLKTVVPAIVTVDSSTGHVVKVEVVTPETMTGNEAVIHNELHEYAIHRNSVDPADRQRLADLVHLHSSQEVGKEYDYEMSPENPGNPYYLVGPNGKRTVEVTGISLLNRETGQVSFKTTTRKAGSEPKTEFWTAIVRFTFTGKPLALNDRWENPLGFAVTAYRRDQELSHN